MEDKKENKINLPPGVDEILYKEYWEYKEVIEKHELRWYQCQGGHKFDLMMSMASLWKQKNKFEVSEEEYELVKAQKLMYKPLLEELLKKREAAFGKQIENHKEEKAIIENELQGLSQDAFQKKTEILELFGKFYRVEEVFKIIKDEWKIKVPYAGLQFFYRANIDIIEELKRDYENSVPDVRLGKRRSRLDELTFIYSRIKTKFLAYESREDAKMLQSLLESIKKEVDGDLVINGKLQVDIEHSINIQVQNQMLKDLNISALIVAKLAGRLNINPIFLLSRLSNSYYSKFTGFGHANRQEMVEDEIYYPSGIAYDWNNIIIANAESNEEDKNSQNLGEIQEAEIVEVMSIKDRILAELKEKQKLVEQSHNEIAKFQK